MKTISKTTKEATERSVIKNADDAVICHTHFKIFTLKHTFLNVYTMDNGFPNRLL